MNNKVFTMKLSKIYPLLVNKVIKKGYTEDDVLDIIFWLLNYSKKEVRDLVNSDISYGDFINNANFNKDAFDIKGKICGEDIALIDDLLYKKIRILDKLIDDLAKGKKLKLIK